MEKRPRSIFPITFGLLYGLAILSALWFWSRALNVPLEEAAAWQIAAQNMNPLSELFYRGLSSAVFAAIIAIPVDLFRYLRYRQRTRRSKTATPQSVTPPTVAD